MIYDFINDVCEILNISAPSVSFDTSNFTTDTMMAQCEPDGSIIYLRNYDKPNLDQFFSIAHELRHIWQMKNDEQLYFSAYKPVNLCSSVEEYNLQIAELDANAFASIIIVEYFHMQPQWNGLSDKVVNAINDRINIIIRELND